MIETILYVVLLDIFEKSHFFSKTGEDLNFLRYICPYNYTTGGAADWALPNCKIGARAEPPYTYWAFYFGSKIREINMHLREAGTYLTNISIEEIHLVLLRSDIYLKR